MINLACNEEKKVTAIKKKKNKYIYIKKRNIMCKIMHHCEEILTLGVIVL
jgi:hypothetical protein